MGFARKVKRSNAPKVPRRCKMKMSRKMGYDTETHHFYFCECCGKEKWVEVKSDDFCSYGERREGE
jgi:hypothetical protein